MAIQRWTPFRELMDMPREMRRMFSRPLSLLEEPFAIPGMEPVSFGPALDIFSQESDMMIRMEIPGINVEDVDISLMEHTLCLSGERRADKEVKEGDYFRRERSYGRFERCLPIPEKITEKDIEATYEDGVLEIRVMGAIESAPAKHIEVKSSQGKGTKIKAKKA